MKNLLQAFLIVFCTSCTIPSNSQLTDTEYTILHSTYMLECLSEMLTKSGCVSMDSPDSLDAFASAFGYFYNYDNAPSAFVDATRNLLQRNGQDAFDREVKLHCRKELWFFADTAFTDLISTLEAHPEIRAVIDPINNWNEWLEHFEMCDRFCKYVLEEQYGTIIQDNLTLADETKEIKRCRKAFAKALEIEKKRCGDMKEPDPVFYLVCGAVVSSYHVPEFFLVEFRKEMIKHAADKCVISNFNAEGQ